MPAGTGSYGVRWHPWGIYPDYTMLSSQIKRCFLKINKFLCFHSPLGQEIMSNPLTSFIFNAILTVSANCMAVNSSTAGTLPSERKPSAARFPGKHLRTPAGSSAQNRGVYPALQDSRGRLFRLQFGWYHGEFFVPYAGRSFLFCLKQSERNDPTEMDRSE